MVFWNFWELKSNFRSFTKLRLFLDPLVKRRTLFNLSNQETNNLKFNSSQIFPSSHWKESMIDTHHKRSHSGCFIICTSTISIVLNGLHVLMTTFTSTQENWKSSCDPLTARNRSSLVSQTKKFFEPPFQAEMYVFLLLTGQAGRGNSEEFGLLSLEFDENFCMGGPGVIMSRETLKRVAPHIPTCLKNLYSTHEDVEVGRCVQKFAGIPCTWNYQVHFSKLLSCGVSK